MNVRQLHVPIYNIMSLHLLNDAIDRNAARNYAAEYMKTSAAVKEAIRLLENPSLGGEPPKSPIVLVPPPPLSRQGSLAAFLQGSHKGDSHKKRKRTCADVDKAHVAQAAKEMFYDAMACRCGDAACMGECELE